MRHRFLPILLLGLCCLGFGRKELPLSIRFYTQALEGDSDSFAVPVTLLNGKQIYLDKIPNISEQDIVAFYPFVAPDGSGGAAFQLDEHGAMSLDSLSNEKRGTALIAVINGHQVSDIIIDQRVTDGIVVIPGGITTDDMILIHKRYPIMGGKKAVKTGRKDTYSVGM